VAAAVVPEVGARALDFDALRAFARQHLAGYKVPTVWHQVAQLPRNSSGKVLRRVLIDTHHAAALIGSAAREEGPAWP
jgi:acyl-CoA synthetase (AMP-forming)/AMP-acid ligase II